MRLSSSTCDIQVAPFSLDKWSDEAFLQDEGK